MDSAFQPFQQSGPGARGSGLGACFSKVPKLFGPSSGATIPFICSQGGGSKPSNFAFPLLFPKLKTRSKTIGLQFENWLFGPEKLSGLSRNRPLIDKAMVLGTWFISTPL